MSKPQTTPRLTSIETADIRIGVYLCHCGVNIAGVIDMDDMVEYAQSLPNVFVAK